MKKAHAVAVGCCEELDAYGRLLGRRPESKGAICALSLLPADMPERQSAEARVRELAATGSFATVGDVVAVVGGGDPGEKFTTGHWRKAAGTLARLGLGSTPDPDLSMARITPDATAMTYPLPPGSDEVTGPMSATALVLQIGALVAGADGVVSDDEREELRRVAVEADLDPRQRARLCAHADWLMSTSSRPTDLRARLAKAPDESRARIVEVALDVARRDGHLAAAEVRQLEQIFSWLGLATTSLYSALHGGEPVEIVRASATAPGEPVPRPAAVATAISAPSQRRLNRDKIAAITRDSALSAQLLQTVFATDEDDVRETAPASAAVDEPADDPTFANLRGIPLAFARRVCERDLWPRAELEEVARKESVMLDGIIERVNDWSLDALGDLLIEDGDPVRVNRVLLRLVEAAE